VTESSLKKIDLLGTNSRSDALGEHKLEGLNLNEERVHLGSPGIGWRLRRELSLAAE
jgi:hypothetical protein